MKLVRRTLGYYYKIRQWIIKLLHEGDYIDMSNEWITIKQLLNDTTKEQREWLRDWWKPEPGDRYYDPQFSFPCVVPDVAALDDYKGKFVPLLSVGQMIEIINPVIRPKFFKVTKNAQSYYRKRHNPSVKLIVGYWAIFCRQPHKNAWQHKIYTERHLVDACWAAMQFVLKLKVVR